MGPLKWNKLIFKLQTSKRRKKRIFHSVHLQPILKKLCLQLPEKLHEAVDALAFSYRVIVYLRVSEEVKMCLSGVQQFITQNKKKKKKRGIEVSLLRNLYLFLKRTKSPTKYPISFHYAASATSCGTLFIRYV